MGRWVASSRLWALLAVLSLLGFAAQHTVMAAGANVRAEHEVAGPRQVRTPQVPAQLKPQTVTVQQAGSRLTTVAAATPSSGFLTLPYLNDHAITSIFDHCNPDYTQDGKVCRFDGAVGLKTNGVDPNFTLGYAMTPGGTDYLYYDGHNGYDYALYYEPVRAAADGTVRIAGSDPLNPCFGQTVVVDHPNGFSTRYAHMSSIIVAVGQAVTRGQVLGTSGNTGCSSGPHLHFGVYITSSWTAVDPYGWTGSTADPWPSDQGDLWLTGSPRFVLPDAPTDVLALAGDASATVSWTAPAYTGGLPLSGFTVTAAPGGASVTAGGSATSAVLSGLANGTTYTFTVVASNAVGSGAASGASNAITPPAWPGRFHALTPARILDTRSGSGPVGPGQTIDIQVLGHGGIPVTNVAAVVVNVTVTDATQPSYVTVFASGTARPVISDLDFAAGQTIADLTEVPVGAGGKVSIFNLAGTTDIILDVFGWVSAQGTTTSTAGQYRPVVPARILDTRTGTGPLGPNQSFDLQVSGQGGIPGSGASAVVVNLTVTGPTAASYLAIYPAGTSRPLVSSMDFPAGQTLANRAVVALGTGGKVSLYNLAGSTQVIVDVVGWFTDGSVVGSGGEYTAVTPARVLDTRYGIGGISSPLGAGQSVTVSVAGRAGVPPMTASTSPTAVAVIVTVTDATQASYLTVYPSGASQPSTSDLDFSAGATLSNLVVAKLGPDGKLAIYNLAGSTDVIVDVLGWYN